MDSLKWKLHEWDYIPEGLLDSPPNEVNKVLPGPSLFHLNGVRKPALFVSVLLHGNETTGYLAIQRVLKKYQDKALPRSLTIFIGNVEAAALRRRHLDNERDFNRVWSGGEEPQQKLATQVQEIVSKAGCFASVDIHNNSGRNPHYACVANLHPSHLNLATLFCRTVVYVKRPETTQLVAFSKIAPSVVIECGLPGTESSVEHAEDFLDALLHLSDISPKTTVHQDIDLYETVARIEKPKESSISFEDFAKADFVLREDLDSLNFSILQAGTELGKTNGQRLLVYDDRGKEIPNALLEYSGERILLKEEVVPSMLTKDVQIISDDCLGYLMRRRSF